MCISVGGHAVSIHEMAGNIAEVEESAVTLSLYLTGKGEVCCQGVL